MTRLRFTDCNKWRDPWFMGLAPLNKLVWIYLVDTCDNAGVWVANERLANLEIGAEVDWKEAANVMFGRIRVFDEGRKWYLVHFIRSQHPGGLNRANRAHGQVLRLLSHHGLKEEGDQHLKEGPWKGPSDGASDGPSDGPLSSSSSSSGGDARGGVRSRGDVVRELAAEFGLAGNPSAINEWVIFLRDHAQIHGARETRAFVAWVTETAAKNGTEMKYARHAGEAAVRCWRENHQAAWQGKA